MLDAQTIRQRLKRTSFYSDSFQKSVSQRKGGLEETRMEVMQMMDKDRTKRGCVRSGAADFIDGAAAMGSHRTKLSASLRLCIIIVC